VGKGVQQGSERDKFEDLYPLRLTIMLDSNGFFNFGQAP
jgi:hypothetical protein